MESGLREAFDIIFGSIAPGYYVLAVVLAIALVFFLRQNAVNYQVEAARADEKVRLIVAAFDITERLDTPGLTGYGGGRQQRLLRGSLALKKS